VPQPIDLYAWRNAVMSERGPSNPLARLVLMAISLHMKSDGTGAWPAQKLLAERTGMGERSVRRHLDALDRDGWIGRIRVRRDGGHAWYRTEYEALVPDNVYEHLPERPWETDPQWRRQPATVAATRPINTGGASTMQAPNNRPIGAEQPATQAEVPATHDRTTGQSEQNNRPSFGRLTLPLNSSENYPKNSSHEGALARTARVRARPKSSPEEIERRRREAAELCARLEAEGFAKRGESL